jgi:F-type H+-transporting ATPase subunit alpha
MLNQGERQPMAVEDQVAQIYAATNGFLDRIVVDKVERFLRDLVGSVNGTEPELMKQIAGGDWSDETQSALKQAISGFAEDFGYDLDEEGHPLEEGEAPSSKKDKKEDDRPPADDEEDGEAKAA